MSLNSFLFDFHSLVEKGLKKPFDEAKVKLNQILFALQGTKIEDLKDDIFLIPGKFYSYSNPDATIENLTKLFNDLIDCQEFLISDDQVVVDVFLQIIAFDFKHFMELFSQQREKLPDLIVYKVYQVILDPTTGFLKNAPLSKRNNVWNDPNHYFQFFQKDSADLQTPFGKTLTSLREHLSKLLVDSLSEEKYEIVYNDRPTICIPSILPTLLSSIIPPYFFGSGIECGFPGRPQTLFAISKLQKLTTYSKFYKDHSDNQDIIDSWIDLYIEISGFETRVNEEKLNILRPTPIIWSPKIALFKLFLNITPTLWDVSNQSRSSNNSSQDDIKDKKYFQEMDIFAKHIVYSIIGQDSVYASFLIFWTQIMIYLIPKFSCIVFDHLFLLMDSYYKLSYNQKHTYTQSLIRFISILCCHYERYLDESQTIRIHSFAMLNLCSSSPSIRYLSLKLLRTLHRFLNNEDNQKKSILYFFDDPKGSSKFQESFLKIFRENPSILMQTNLLIPPIQPSIIDLIHSGNYSIWHISLLSLSLLLKDFFDQQTHEDFKEFGVSYSEKLTRYVFSHTNISPEKIRGLKVSLIFLHTLLGPFANVQNISIDNDEHFKKQLELSKKIVYQGSVVSVKLSNEFYHKLHVMFRSFNLSAFSYALSIYKSISEIRNLVLILYAFVTNFENSSMMGNNEFKQSFMFIFNRVTKLLLEMKILNQSPTFGKNFNDPKPNQDSKEAPEPIDLASTKSNLLMGVPIGQGKMKISKFKSSQNLKRYIYNNKLPPNPRKFIFIKSDKHIISENAVVVCDYLLVVYTLFQFYESQFKEEIQSVLPISPIVIDTSIPELKHLSHLFVPILNLTSFPSQTLIEKKMHIFATHAFSKFVTCISIPDVSLYLNQQFFDRVYKTSLELPSVMTNLMAHHFALLFPRFLESALCPGGKQYFHAISSLFEIYPSEFERSPLEYFINKLWKQRHYMNQKNSIDIDRTDPIVSEYLEVMYENCGTFLLCCLFYLVEPEKELSYCAFLLLGAITPILAIYHFHGRSDFAKPIIKAFLRFATLYGHSISNLQISTIIEISELLSENFSFCLDQFLDDALDYIPQFPSETVNRTLTIIIPWFQRVDFDMENRVISKETDLLFMRFSCYSFIDKLLSSVPQIDLVNVNSPSMKIWRTLVMDGDTPKMNIVPILIMLMNAAENASNHSKLQPLIRYLYRLHSRTVSDCFASFLTFSYNFYYSNFFDYYNICYYTGTNNSNGKIRSSSSNVNSLSLHSSGSHSDGLYQAFNSSTFYFNAFCSSAFCSNINFNSLSKSNSNFKLSDYFNSNSDLSTHSNDDHHSSSGFSSITNFSSNNLDSNITNILSFVLSQLPILVSDSIAPILPNLPIIFSFALVNIDVYFDRVNTLTSTIFDQLRFLVDNSSLPIYNEAYQKVRLIYKTEDLSKINRQKTKISKSMSSILKGNLSASGTNLTQLSSSFTALFNTHDNKHWNTDHDEDDQMVNQNFETNDLVINADCSTYDIAPSNSPRVPYSLFSNADKFDENYSTANSFSKQYETMLLQWALCCSDLMRATNAFYCLQGSITKIDNDVVGLIARSMFSVAEIAEFLTNFDEKNSKQVEAENLYGTYHFNRITNHVFYLRAALLTLKTIAQSHDENGTLFTLSSVLWIAIESLKCNASQLSIIFEAALELLNLFLMKQDLFSLVSKRGEYVGGQFTPGTFWKFHEPWGEEFHGCGITILECENPSNFFKLVIKTLNLLIQANFPNLFSDSTKWIYTALLSLLPWIWTIILTDLNQFRFHTRSVQMLIKTHSIIIKFLQEYSNSADISSESKVVNQKIINSLKLVISDEKFDLYHEMIKITEKIVHLMDQDHLKSLAIFFKNYLRYGPSFSKIPLYSIVTKILETSKESAKYFSGFITVASSDMDSARKVYIDLLMDKFTTVEKAVNVYKFPNLILFDRIVAILIPQMYEYNPSENIIKDFDDFQSLPPILPRETNLSLNPNIRTGNKEIHDSLYLMQNKKYVNLIQTFHKMKIDPFYSWSEILSKMHTSLIDDDLLLNKKMHSAQDIKINRIMTQVLNQIHEETINSTIEVNDVQSETQSTEMNDAYNISDPYEFISLEPFMFVPSFEEVNYIGDELFDNVY